MIFLGQASNYRFGRALRHLFAHGNKHDLESLQLALAKRYQVELADGNVYHGQKGLAEAAKERVRLYQTGRSALAAAIMVVAPKGSKVVIPGLTCIAVVRAVKAAGCEPVFADINSQTLQYDWKSLDKTLKVCYNGVIVAQNTLGLPIDMQKLEDLAAKHHCQIVEDLAHSAGRFYPDGREVGTVGAATALSFGKGKAIDTIAGGALILRKGIAGAIAAPMQKPRLGDRWRARWYPLLGNIMRAGYHVGLGKVVTAVFLKFHWIKRSADAELNLDQKLMPWQAKLALRQLGNLPKTPLREWCLVKKREELLRECKKRGYYLDEIWYDAPVSPARYAKEADFPAKDCPETVRVAKQIINLPTWYPEEKLAPVRVLIKQYQEDDHE